jgi:phasin family protein
MNSPAVEQTGQLGRAVIGPVADIAQRTFEGFEQLTHLNLQTVKTTLAEQKAIAEEAVTSNSLEWVASLPSAQAQAALKKALAYWRHASNIAIETAADNIGSGWCTFNEYANWAASWLGDAANAASETTRLGMAYQDATVQAEAESAFPFAPAGGKSGGRGRSRPLVDDGKHAASSPKH